MKPMVCGAVLYNSQGTSIEVAGAKRLKIWDYKSEYDFIVKNIFIN